MSEAIEPLSAAEESAVDTTMPTPEVRQGEQVRKKVNLLDPTPPPPVGDDYYLKGALVGPESI